MICTGTIINTLAIILGGLIGYFFGRFISDRLQETLGLANGISVLFIGMAGAFSGMLTLDGGNLSSSHSILIVLSLAFGGLLGEIINIEKFFEDFGLWLKKKTGNEKDGGFVNGFVTASLTVCIGAMAIVGSIQDGLLSDYSTLAVKGLLDFIIIMVMTCSMGKGAIFSFVPVFLLEGSMTLLARFLKPIMTDLALSYLSLVGSVLIFCVGVNLVWGKKIRVANLLPSLVFAVIFAFLPFSF